MKNRKENLKLDKKKIVILLIVLLFLIISFIGVAFFIKDRNIEIDYNKKMDIFGMSSLYDDNDEVTRIEALKISIAAIKNKENISQIYSTDGVSDDTWIECATRNKDEIKYIITTQNKNENLRIIDELVLLNYFSSTYLDIYNDKKMESQSSELYSDFEIQTIDFMTKNDIITGNEDLTQILTSEKLNQIIVKFIYKFNTLLDYDVEEGTTLSLDMSKFPSNYKMYPYILNNIDKKAYEIDFKNGKNYIAPVDLYKDIKSDYYKINKAVNEYLDSILNIDFLNLNEEKLINTIEINSNYDNSYINDYISKVKNNNVIIEGNHKIINPCIYKVGNNYLVRVYIEYNIKQSNIKDNLLFGDDGVINQIYKVNSKKSFYIDLELKKDGGNYVISSNSINNQIIK